MRSVRRWGALAAAMAAALVPGYCAGQSAREELVAPGVSFRQEIRGGAVPLIVNIVTIDLGVDGVTVASAQSRGQIIQYGPQSGREAVPSIAARVGAAVAVNADYFPYNGDPLGLEVHGGELLSEPFPGRAVFAIGPEGPVIGVATGQGAIRNATTPGTLPLAALNRVPHNNEVAALTPSYGSAASPGGPATYAVIRCEDLPLRPGRAVHGNVESTGSLPAGVAAPVPEQDTVVVLGVGTGAASVASALHQGDLVGVSWDLSVAAHGSEAGHISEAVGGGPILVRDGKAALDGAAEGFPTASFVLHRHPRSAVGILDNHRIVIVTVDGRQALSGGATLPEMADILVSLGATSAMNLDGGNSTTLVVGGLVVNAPSDGACRPVADALVVKVASSPRAAQPAAGTGDSLHVAAVAGTTVQLTAPSATQAHAVWGTLDGRAFVSQDGRLTALRSGTVEVAAVTPDSTQHYSVTVTPGPAARMTATLAHTPQPDTDRVRIAVTDAFGNAVGGAEVRVAVEGGTPSDGTGLSDQHGVALVDIAWQPDATTRKVTVTSQSVPAVVIRPGTARKP